VLCGWHRTSSSMGVDSGGGVGVCSSSMLESKLIGVDPCVVEGCFCLWALSWSTLDSSLVCDFSSMG
jgi:hypothetical protein